jgi:hypothetical protein
MIALEDGGYDSASDYDEDTLALLASDEQCALAPTEQESEYMGTRTIIPKIDVLVLLLMSSLVLLPYGALNTVVLIIPKIDVLVLLLMSSLVLLPYGALNTVVLIMLIQSLRGML